MATIQNNNATLNHILNTIIPSLPTVSRTQKVAVLIGVYSTEYWDVQYTFNGETETTSLGEASNAVEVPYLNPDNSDISVGILLVVDANTTLKIIDSGGEGIAGTDATSFPYTDSGDESIYNIGTTSGYIMCGGYF